MSESEEGFEARLDAVLRAKVSGVDGLTACERLSGGASQESYRLTVATAAGERRLALRRASATGEDADPSGRRIGLAGEAALFRLARAAGVPEPEVFHVLEPADGLGSGFIMEWIDGETLGARIARHDRFAEIRPRLAYQCGEIMARIHALDVAETGLAERFRSLSPADLVEVTWADYRALPTAQPMIDYAGRWLLENLPSAARTTLVHGDLRSGNMIVDPEKGVVAVLDWEVAHLGDPMRDLGWICTNSWRFGRTGHPVGGFGTREDLFAGYEAVSGRPVDPDHVRFWEVFGSFWWAIGCLRMAENYRQGQDASVERPGIARRSSECQIDCVNLLIPGPVDLPPATAMTLSTDMPDSAELLVSVRDFLRGPVMAETEGRTSFLARVGANSLDIVLRELEMGPAHRARQQAALAALLGRQGGLEDLQTELVMALREGTMALDRPGLREFLRDSVATQCAIDQPSYSGLKTALARAG